MTDNEKFVTSLVSGVRYAERECIRLATQRGKQSALHRADTAYWEGIRDATRQIVGHFASMIPAEPTNCL